MTRCSPNRRSLRHLPKLFRLTGSAMSASDPIFSRIFPTSVTAVRATPAMYDAPLYPDEDPAVAKAVLSRRREFAAGRAAVREALRRCGEQQASLPAQPDRQPRWPAGYTGSISHCDGFCAAAVTRRSIILSVGLDVEPAVNLPRELQPLIFSQEERIRLEATGRQISPPWCRIGFCAKEAFYKGYYAIEEKYLDFLDVDLVLGVDPDGQSGDFYVTIRSSSRFIGDRSSPVRGRWLADQGFVIAGTVQRAAD